MNDVITFDLPVEPALALLVGVVLPLLVGLVTNRTTDPGRRATILAALAAVLGLGSELLAALRTDTTYDLGTGLVTAVGTFLVAVGLHYGFWKPKGASEAVQDVSVPGIKSSNGY